MSNEEKVAFIGSHGICSRIADGKVEALDVWLDSERQAHEAWVDVTAFSRLDVMRWIGY